MYFKEGFYLHICPLKILFKLKKTASVSKLGKVIKDSCIAQIGNYLLCGGSYITLKLLASAVLHRDQEGQY